MENAVDLHVGGTCSVSLAGIETGRAFDFAFSDDRRIHKVVVEETLGTAL